MKKISIFIFSFIIWSICNLLYIPMVYSQSIESNQGVEIFTINCAGCHPNGGNIIRRGKNLRLKALEKNGYNSVDSIENIITHGKNNMSSFVDRLTSEEINIVAKYVLSQAENNWELEH
jgi:cytochrome c6